MTHRKIPPSYFVYEYSYPVGVPELAGIVFYVGKATNATRLDSHFTEAASGCICAKCQAIRFIWDLGLVAVRRIVFESRSEVETLAVEKQRIAKHLSPHLTNFQHNTHRRVRNAPVQIESVLEASKYCQIGSGHFSHYSNVYGLARCIDGDIEGYRKSDLDAFRQWMLEHYPLVGMRKRILDQRDIEGRRKAELSESKPIDPEMFMLQLIAQL